ncbi:MAG: hypothetical protein A2073_02720 [Deltaproteobacteria bacterium GWC2_42_11]|nr:MAG: hypothetical protein A2073_02720 [Deltaproteobacteria bacterium GWC2_42_11]
MGGYTFSGRITKLTVSNGAQRKSGQVERFILLYLNLFSISFLSMLDFDDNQELHEQALYRFQRGNKWQKGIV